MSLLFAALWATPASDCAQWHVGSPTLTLVALRPFEDALPSSGISVLSVVRDSIQWRFIECVSS